MAFMKLSLIPLETYRQKSILIALFVAALSTGYQAVGQAPATRLFVDCSQAAAGDGSSAHPWNTLDALSAHLFKPGQVSAIKRGTVCQGTLSLHGSGSPDAGVRLTAYGEGARPKIVASNKDTQALLLRNAEYWQIDSLDISGGSKYGLLVAGDQDKVQSHITLRNLVVHDLQGGELKDKDNGLVVFLRGSKLQRFDDVLIEDVVVAHTNQWSGIMMGAGTFYSDEDGYNRNVVIRNSVAHDVYGDGIILFRVRNGVIDSSTAWLTGQQPTQNVGTPNAIWTWSCTDCTVRNNEAFLTESPGVDGGAYDIDWATTRNTVEQNYAHDTQGYCVAAFGAGYVTHAAVLRNNVCVDNGLSPRMARLQGAIYIHTWDGGKIEGLTIENNFIDWNPPAEAAAIVNDDGTELTGSPLIVRNNVIRGTSPLLIKSFGKQLVFAGNRYQYTGLADPCWTWNGRTWHTLSAVQAAGAEKGSQVDVQSASPARDPTQSTAGPKSSMSALGNRTTLDGQLLPAVQKAQYRLVLPFALTLDNDGLLSPDVMARLSVLRTLAREYNPRQLQIVVVVPNAVVTETLRNALSDLDAPSIRFVHASARDGAMSIELVSAQGYIASRWPASLSNFNAAAIGYAVRQALGVPVYAQMDSRP